MDYCFAQDPKNVSPIFNNSDCPECKTALVIGITSYSEFPLKNPVNDARAMDKVLQELGFTVELVVDKNRREILKAIKRFGKFLKKGGVGLFYYSGHGIQMDGKNYLIPLAYLITPNIYEASILTEIKLDTFENVKKAAKKIYQMGVQNVLIKGGHIEFSKDAIDFLYDGRTFTEFRTERINTNNTHGTGCTYASAISAEIAKGLNLIDAIHVAKSYLTAAIARADTLHVGNGYGPVDHCQDTIVGVDLELVNVVNLGSK